MVRYLESFNDEVVCAEHEISSTGNLLEHTTFLVSYGYRYILRKEILDKFPQRAINLHVSLLPWNRGADPNLWSFLEDTPKGVTIHLLAPGIDTGDILAHQEVCMGTEDTLRTSYDKLSHAMVSLFMESWPKIRTGRITAVPQPPGGSYHRLRDKGHYEHLLVQGWDTPVTNLAGKALYSIGGDLK